MVTSPPTLEQRILSSQLLIVDDSHTNRLLLENIYRTHGFTRIALANDGREGLEKTRHLRPDLVVLDLLMPQMDGFEYCHRLRAEPDLADMPVLVQTAMDSQDKRVQVFEAGATDLITKPVHAKELMARTRVHLENRYLLADLQRYHKRVQAELEASRQMQLSLMPQESMHDHCRAQYGLDIHARFTMASEMGGDMWGVCPLGAHEVGFFLCDFAGHGVTAALNVFRLHALLQETWDFAHDPGAYLNLLNRRLHALIARGQFATLFYGVLDTQRNLLRYASAGATSPVLWQAASAKARLIDSRGIPLGAVADAGYGTTEITFMPGDMLMLYSDALTETPMENGNCLNEPEICRFIETRAHGERSLLLNRLVGHYFGNAPEFLDDLTLILFSR